MKRPSLAGRLLIFLIRAYQRVISPLLSSRCRFHPSCSAYAIEAIEKKGTLVGGMKGLWRVLRCNPFHLGGYDPVEHNGCEQQGKPGPRDAGSRGESETR